MALQRTPELGLIHDWGGAGWAGIPYQLWFDSWGVHPNPYADYAAAGKPVPIHDNEVVFDDGSRWQFTFSYADPWTYTSKVQMSQPTTPNTPAVPIAPVIPNPFVPPTSPTIPTIPPTTPTTPSQPVNNGGGDAGALLGIGLMAAIGGFFTGHRMSRRKLNTARHARKQKTSKRAKRTKRG